MDGIFVGPSDLAADMGYPGMAGDPAVQQVVNAALSQIKAAGRPSGILTSDPVLLDGYFARNVTFVAVGSDVGLLTSALSTLRKRWPSNG